jgi:hypothetical protein
VLRGRRDDGCEAYTAIMRSGILSREKFNDAEAETFESVEGNTLCTAVQGVTALPWSETPLRMKGKPSELGRPHLAHTASAVRCGADQATAGRVGPRCDREASRDRSEFGLPRVGGIAARRQSGWSAYRSSVGADLGDRPATDAPSHQLGTIGNRA